jgi:hypothetical protein
MSCPWYSTPDSTPDRITKPEKTKLRKYRVERNQTLCVQRSVPDRQSYQNRMKEMASWLVWTSIIISVDTGNK